MMNIQVDFAVKRPSVVSPKWIIFSTCYVCTLCGNTFPGRSYLFQGKDYNNMVQVTDLIDKFYYFLDFDHLSEIQELNNQEDTHHWKFEIDVISTLQTNSSLERHWKTLLKEGYTPSIYRSHEFQITVQ